MERLILVSAATTGNGIPGKMDEIIEFSGRVLDLECVDGKVECAEVKSTTKRAVPDGTLPASATAYCGLVKERLQECLADGKVQTESQIVTDVSKIITGCADKGIYIVGWNVPGLIQETLAPLVKKHLGTDFDVSNARVIDLKKLCSLALDPHEVGSCTQDAADFIYSGKNVDSLCTIRAEKLLNCTGVSNIQNLTILEGWMAQNGITTLADVVKWQNEPHVIKYFTFGKYRGSLIADVINQDVGYIGWVLKNKEISERETDLIYSIKNLMNAVD